jgi:hypothetical protein
MSPYKIIDENDSHVTYEYRTAYTWALYIAVIVFLLGALLVNDTIKWIGFIAMGMNLVLKLICGSRATTLIRKAMRSNTVQISGNKSSFSNPLRIRVPR